MYFLYSLLLGLGFLILLPRFLFDAFHHGKYVAGFRERLGSISPLQNRGRPVIWIHCVSVGETQAARPLVQGLRKTLPECAIVISTITLTGQNLAHEIFKNDAEKVFYFPFDWRWITRRTLKAINPVAVLLLETELWPGFLRECDSQRIPVAIVNGRISERSFRRYRLIRGFMRRLLGSVDLALMQTEADAERIKRLGMGRNKIFVSGNLKFDAGTAVTTDFTQQLRERFHLTNGRPLVLAASTHAPEERIVLEAFKQILCKAATRPRLMIAPRHPERFAEVVGLIKASGFNWARRTASPDPEDAQRDVILLDSIGELQSVYSLAPIVFVGGSIAKTGGHNILEPAAAGACVITGAYTYNFQMIVETFVKAGAVIQLARMSEAEAQEKLADIILKVLADAVGREQLGRRAKALVDKNRGATEHTIKLLGSILPSSASSPKDVNGVRVQSAPSS